MLQMRMMMMMTATEMMIPLYDSSISQLSAAHHNSQ